MKNTISQSRIETNLSELYRPILTADGDAGYLR